MGMLKNKHLISLNNTSVSDLNKILDTGFTFREVLERPIKKVPSLNGINVVNLFFV